MAIFQELTNQGRVVGGHFTNGTVLAAKSDLVVQYLVKRQKINSDTVREWEEISTKGSVASSFGQSAAGAMLPGRLGKSLGAGVGAAMNAGHTIRVDWVDGKHSVIELPEKLFMVLVTLLNDRQKVAETLPEATTPTPPQPDVTEQLVGLASSIIQGRQKPAEEPPAAAALHNDRVAQVDVAEQIAKLAALHEQGILTDDEFTNKKTELLSRL